jgi:ubiquinone biosynthesis protein UbiJ
MNMESLSFETLIEQIVNRVLRLDPETLRRLGELNGKTIRLGLGDGAGALTLFVEPSAEGLRLRRESEREPDVTLRGSIPLFARLARTGIAAGELQISGDVELGSRFKRILEGIELDWEEPLSRMVGDVAAHQIGRAVRATAAWGRKAGRTLAQDTAEYLQEESRVLAARVRVEEFLRAVDGLRTDADRLQKRVERLEQGQLERGGR